MKAAYKYTDGTNEKFFDVLYIEEDGSLTLEHHNSQRTLSWPARMEDGQFGQVVRYGKGSSIPFTDQKGNMRPHWGVLTAEQVATITAPSPTPSDEQTEDATDSRAAAVITPEDEAGTATADTPAETATRRTRGRRKADDDYGRVVVPTGAESPSDTTETATDEMPNMNDEATAESDTGEAVRNLAAILSMMTRSKAVRELAKGVGILAALFVIWQTGLLIPFALLGGIAAGVVK